MTNNRVVVLTTRTNNTPQFYEPLLGLGYELIVIVYDVLFLEDMTQLVGMVDQHQPDWVLFIGAIEKYHNWPVPTADILAQIGAKYPMVLFCCDSAEPAWWEQLERYRTRGKFAVMVGVDGTYTGPIARHGLVLLSPFDSKDYQPQPAWEERSISLGFCGSTAYPPQRLELLAELVKQQVLVVRPREYQSSSGYYRNFMINCKAILNTAWTGSGEALHVKGRVIEAGLAGAVLIEHVDAPTKEWFDRGVHYLTYKDAEDVVRQVQWIADHPRDAAAMARRFQDAVLTEHNPAAFWRKVLVHAYEPTWG